MTTLEITLICIIYAFLAVIVYKKQRKIDRNVFLDSVSDSTILALIAPLAIIFYAIRAVFFEDWL